MGNKSCFLLILFLVALFSGCSKDEQEPQLPLHLTVLYPNVAHIPYNPEWRILKEYERRKQVELQFELGEDGDYKTYIDQQFSAPEPVQVLLKVWPEEIQSYALQGLVIPISDYEDYLPNFKRYIAIHGYETQLDALRESNGKYYVLPGFQRELQVQQWIYRKDLFEKHEIRTPETYDELYDALVVLKSLYPESNPLSGCWGGAHLFAMMGAGYGIPAGWNGFRYYDKTYDAWKFSPATEQYKELLRFLHRCYESGILDAALFTQSEADFYQKLQNGTVFTAVSWITSGFANWNTVLQQQGYQDANWAPLPVPESTIGRKALPPVASYRKGLCITSEAKNDPRFHDILSFLDWALYSDEGITLTYWGIEGETFIQKASGKEFLPNIRTSLHQEGEVDPRADLGLDMIFNIVEEESYEDAKKPSEIVAFLNRSLAAGETLPANPSLVLSESLQKVEELLEDSLHPYVEKTTRQFIEGSLSIEQDWSGYLKTLEDNGYRTLEELWNLNWAAQQKAEVSAQSQAD